MIASPYTAMLIFFVSATSILLNAGALSGKLYKIIPGLLGTLGTTYYIYRLHYATWRVFLHLLLVPLLSFALAYVLKKYLTKVV
jgi:hypothetical protein